MQMNSSTIETGSYFVTSTFNSFHYSLVNKQKTLLAESQEESTHVNSAQ